MQIQGRPLEGGFFPGQGSRKNVPPKFAKIKPKKAASFVHGKIGSNQTYEFVEHYNTRKSVHCSLGSSISPGSEESGRNKNYNSSHSPSCNLEVSGLLNDAAISRTIEDIEFDSDGEPQCINMILSSSSKDANTEDGEDADSQSSDAYENQTDINWQFWRTFGAFLAKIKSGQRLRYR